MSTAVKEITDKLVQVPVVEGRYVVELESEDYYHGFIARKESEDLVMKGRGGSFLVRKADIGSSYNYVIVVKQSGKAYNFLVKQTVKKRLYYVNSFAFKRPNQLIQYHWKNNVGFMSKDGDILLKNPIRQDKFLLYHENLQQKKILGEGQFGRVYLGMLNTSFFFPPKKVAIKMLNHSCITSEERVPFLREAAIMKEFDHVNVVKIYGIAASRDPIMMAMEFCEGNSLEHVITNSETTVDEKINYLLGAAKGLQYIHEQGVIHRDIAARNCLLDKRGRVKISDFGLSVVDSTGKGFSDKKGGKLPVRYMAPETLKTGAYSRMSDSYGFGAMMYELFHKCGEPFGEVDIDGKLLRKAIIQRSVMNQKPHLITFKITLHIFPETKHLAEPEGKKVAIKMKLNFNDQLEVPKNPETMLKLAVLFYKCRCYKPEDRLVFVKASEDTQTIIEYLETFVDK